LVASNHLSVVKTVPANALHLLQAAYTTHAAAQTAMPALFLFCQQANKLLRLPHLYVA
jgi:hypothetical protein